jgi:hypothetical protein
LLRASFSSGVGDEAICSAQEPPASSTSSEYLKEMRDAAVALAGPTSIC